MREIRFRAWDKEIEKMYPVLEIDFVEEWVRMYSKITGRHCNYLDDLVLMQFTGLEDKDGKEIYEGDIVSVKYLYDKRTTDRAQVVWQEDKAGFGLKSLKGLTNEVYELYRVTSKHNLEIIGNIYENKELINE